MHSKTNTQCFSQRRQMAKEKRQQWPRQLRRQQQQNDINMDRAAPKEDECHKTQWAAT